MASTVTVVTLLATASHFVSDSLFWRLVFLMWQSSHLFFMWLRAYAGLTLRANLAWRLVNKVQV